MTVDVLKSARQVAEARAAMKRRGIDCASSFLKRSFRRLGFLPGVDVGDAGKSWDVLKTVEFVERQVPRDAPVLDIGAHQSEVLPVLHRLGYRNLAGADLNPGIGEMPFAGEIRYVACDFMSTPFPDASFACVTAISVIEHGFDAARLLAEMARIVKPGGYFLASVDYWPEKVDTAGVAAYGMDWRIFSADELRGFIADAGGRGFVPVGEARFESRDRVVRWKGRAYTFAWMALRKTP